MHRLSIFLFPGFQLLDACGPIAAFEIASRYAEPNGYEVSLVSMGGNTVRSSSGVALASTPASIQPACDTLMVMGGDGVRIATEDTATLDFVRGQAAFTRRLTSVCSGAFILAAAGLLDGRRATTHWSRTRSFMAAFPKVRLEPDRIFIRDGHVWTSAGITAGIDLALALIAEDLGETVARRTAQQLVVYYRRPGGQSQFSALESLRSGGRFDALMDWARINLTEPLTVETLADKMAMSPRHFARLFLAETGATPAKAIEHLRVEAARGLLDSAALHIEDIAIEAGFGDAERMRRAFLRAFGQPPQAFRRTLARG